MGVIDDDMMRGFPQERKNAVEYLFLKRRLISLYCHDVVESAFAGNVFGGLSLGVRGVHGDHHTVVHTAGDTVEQGRDLGDLVGSRGTATWATVTPSQWIIAENSVNDS